MDCIAVLGASTSGFQILEIERALEALVTFVPAYFNARVEHIVVPGNNSTTTFHGRITQWCIDTHRVATLIPLDDGDDRRSAEDIARFNPFCVAYLYGRNVAVVEMHALKRPRLRWDAVKQQWWLWRRM